MLDESITYDYLTAAGVETNAPPKQSAKSAELEALGWREWLMTLCPFAFEEEFSADHIQYWDLVWSVFMRIREQKKYILLGLPIPEQFLIEDKEYIVLLILGRGLAKSSTIEAMAMMKGCLIGAGYCLTVCESGDQADEHISNIKWLITADESRVIEFYPHMALDENVVFDGKKTKNRTDLFITIGGWICRAKGLDAKLRGIRIGKWRPDLINVDDIDGVNDSIAVSIKKLKQLLNSVFPTIARLHAQINVGQNIIIETGVVNTIYTGMSDALADRTTIGVSNTFEHFRENIEYISELDDEDGRVKHKILLTAQPTWKGVDIAAAQRFLSISGLDTFLAEYMNSFAHQKTGKVFELDEKRHLVTWEAFEAKTGSKCIPGHWRGKASADLGYSKDSLSAWGFYARAAQNAPKDIAGRYFGHRSLTFEMDGIDDQAIEIWKRLFPEPERGKKHFEATQEFGKYPELFRVLNLDGHCSQFLKRFDYNPVKDQFDLRPIDPLNVKEISDEEKALFYVKDANRTFRSQIQSWVISHEKTGEQKTLAKMYGIPATKVKRFEADAGVAEANHLLRGDYTQPHPFYDDEIVPETGLYRLGSPYIFFLVDRILAPRGDQDFKTFREQVGGQRWTQEKLGELGLSKTIPMKYRSDHCLVAGTMITTERGQVPIEDIQIGDMILTRKGYRRCRDAMMTCEAARIWSLTLADGKEIRATSDHKVWVDGKGFTELRFITDTDRMLVCNHSKLKPPVKRSFLKECLTTDTQSPGRKRIVDIIKGLGTAAGSVCTSLYGNLLTAVKFQRAFMFTTGTTIGTITIPQIYNAFLQVSTKATMRDTYPTAKKPIDLSGYKRPRMQRKSGTEARTVLNGTAIMRKIRSLKRWLRLRLHVSIAAKNVFQKHHGGSNFARPDANSDIITAFPTSQRCDRVKSALRSLRLFMLAAKQIRSIVPVSAQAVRITSDVQPVYNLSVEGVSEYFANGVLLRNCDALRMFCVDYALPESTRKTIAEEVAARTPEKYHRKEGVAMSVEDQMSAQAAREAAEEKTKRELGLIDEDEDGEFSDLWTGGL